MAGCIIGSSELSHPAPRDCCLSCGRWVSGGRACSRYRDQLQSPGTGPNSQCVVADLACDGSRPSASSTAS